MSSDKKVFSQVQHHRLSESIEEQIKEAIYNDHYAVGDKLPPERSLAELFGVSRAVVREALRSLEKNGLLEIRTGAQGGAFLTYGENKSFEESLHIMLGTGQVSHEEIIQARLFVEPPIAAEAARLAGPDDIRRMKEANRALEAGFRSEDPFVEHNPRPRLHNVIAEVTGNRLLILIMGVIVNISAQRLSATKMDKASQQRVLAHHMRVVKTIENKDPEAAFKAMQDLIIDVHAIHRQLEEPEAEEPGSATAGRRS